MWRYLLTALLAAALSISNAYADSTKEMKDHDLLTEGAANDTIWVYDTSGSSLKRMTAEEFITDYLGGFGSTNQVLLNDGVGGITWSDLVMGNVSGSGVTTVPTDSGEAISINTGGANRLWIVGGGQTQTSASGNTVTVTTNAVTPAQLTAATDASAFTGDTNFATNTASIGVETTEVVYGGASKFFVYAGTTLTGEMLAGGMLFCHAGSPIVIGIPSFSGSTPYFVVYDMTGSGVTVQTTDGDPLYDGTDAGTAYWVNAGNSRHSASFTCNVESGSCTYVVTLGTSGGEWEID